MLLPGALLNPLLLLSALLLSVLALLIPLLLLGVLLLVLLGLPLLLSMLLVLLVPLLLLGVLLALLGLPLLLLLLLLSMLLVLFIPLLLLLSMLLGLLIPLLLLLSMLLLFRVLLWLLSMLLWLLSMLRFGPGLVVPTLLLGMILLFVLLLVLCVDRSRDSEQQGQNRCAGDSDYSHVCILLVLAVASAALLQASSLRVYRVADGFAGNEKFHSAVLLSSRGVIVRSYCQGVAKTFGCNRISRDSLLHQIVAHRGSAVLREGLIHLVAADLVGIAADFDVESRIGQQNTGDFCQLLPSTRL
jgi:hypothetical protein